MDELDDISPEELAEAARLAEELESSGNSELQPSVALLQASHNWEPRPRALTRGRAEVEEWVAKAPSPERAPSRRPAWLLWLPLPAAALLALLYGTRMQSEGQDAAVARLDVPTAAAPEADADEEFSQKEEPAAPATKLAAADEASPARAKKERWHEDAAPRSLLQTQAELLAARTANKPFDRAPYERELRGYRAQLIARLEMEGQ